MALIQRNEDGTIDLPVKTIAIGSVIVGILVFIGISSFQETDTSIPSGALSESELQEDFRCERETTEVLVTDVYCDNYDLYIEHFEDGDVLEEGDSEDPRYQEALQEQIERRKAEAANLVEFMNEQVIFKHPGDWSTTDEGTFVEILSGDYEEIEEVADSETDPDSAVNNVSKGSQFVWLFEPDLTIEGYFDEVQDDGTVSLERGEAMEINGLPATTIAGVQDGNGQYGYLFEAADGLGLLGYIHEIPVSDNRADYTNAERIEEFEAMAQSVVIR